MTKKEALTPMMKQFYDFKAKHPDALIVMRCGDFYKLLDKDAEVAATVLGLTLTKHNDTGDKIAAFPYHALDVYLPKLIRAGHRVAICDGLWLPSSSAIPLG